MKPNSVGLFYRDYNGQGGMPLEYREIANGLSDLGYDVVVYCYGDSTNVDKREKITIKQFKNNKSNLFFIPSNFKRDISQLKFICFFVVSGHLPENIAVTKALRRTGIKYIFCPGGAYAPYLLKRKRYILLFYKRLFELGILRGADLVRTYSDTNKKFIEDYGYSGDFFELLEGLDESSLPEKLPTAIVRDSTYEFIYLGRLDYYNKGLDQLFLTFEMIKNKGLNFKLILYGHFNSDKDKEIISSWINKLGAEVVDYRGAIYGLDKFNAIRSADALVLPSRFEGIPRSLRESLYTGTPVIITRETNMAEYVIQYNCGFVCKCDSSEILEALMDYSTVVNKEELRLNCERLALDKYSWPKVKSRLAHLMERYIEQD